MSGSAPGALSVTSIPGLLVGHAHDAEALTGCTAILTPGGAVAGVDVRGSAPGTRETDLLEPGNLVEEVHAVLLCGGSAFGLDAAGGVVRWLEERGFGFDTGVARVPIVPAAVLYDLTLGRADRRPDSAMGYAACEAARGGSGAEPPAEGNVGVGAGASVGKILGPAMATKTGLGTACLAGPGGLLVGAVVAVNAFGDVRDPETGAIVAGARRPSGGWLDTAEAMAGDLGLALSGLSNPGQNTTIGAVVTNAILDKAQVRKVAQMAHDGLALTIRPVHTMFDGDALFALSVGDSEEAKVAADVSVTGALAVRAVAEAVLRAALTAAPAGGLPAAGSEHE